MGRKQTLAPPKKDRRRGRQNGHWGGRPQFPGTFPRKSDWTRYAAMRLRLVGLALFSLGVCAVAESPSAPVAELNGRIAGASRNCVQITARSESLRPARNNGHVLLYGSGKTIWASDLGSCGFNRDNDILIVEPSTSSLCRGDIIRAVDRLSKIPGPACVLGDFIPYTRGK
jgi:hypothetical protein